MNENAFSEAMKSDAACRRVKGAIENWYLCGGDGQDVRPILNALKYDADLSVTVPAMIPGTFTGGIPAEELKAGDTFTLEEEMSVAIQRIALQDGTYLTPVFTGLDELMKGEDTDSVSLQFSTILEMALSWENCVGIVINPWGNGFMMTRELLEVLRDYQPQSRLILTKGDITQFHCDAIVNAARKNLMNSGGLNGAIHQAAGPELLEECRTIGGIDAGGVAVTGGYNLDCRYIFHTAGPDCRKDRNPAELLENCYSNALTEAMDMDVRSMVFPCISTGAFGFPKDEAARIALTTIIRCLSEFGEVNRVMDVYICCHSDEDLEAYRRLMI